MPVLEWSISATVRANVEKVYDAETGDSIDVSDKSGVEIVEKLEKGVWLVAIADYPDDIRDCEHTDFMDVDSYLDAMNKLRENEE
jgi:hypothetical protein